jgi:UDP-glucuronate 4-epimerase
MAPMLFTKAILAGEPIRVFNHGRMRRDFTYVDDIVEGVARVMARPPAAAGGAPHRIYNIGNGTPVELLRFIEILERVLGREARKVMTEMQTGDVLETFADVAELEREFGFRPSTPLEEGLARMVAWYRSFYAAR